MKRIGLLIVMALAAMGLKAQEVAIKTNLLYDAALNVNAGIEFGLAPKWTLDLSGDYNSWTVNTRKWKHWFAQPEFRYWFCDRFARHFIGFHAIGGQYNVGNIDFLNFKFLGTDFGKLKDYRYEGWAVGGGIAYGYDWIINRHWNFEVEIGIGYVYFNYDRYECQECGKKVGKGHHNYYGPTKAALNLVYVF